MIFPEGTNSNRKSLPKFKPGAFIPGVPVQPVLLRFEGWDTLCSSRPLTRPEEEGPGNEVKKGTIHTWLRPDILES